LQPVIRDWQADGSLLEIGGKALVPAHARKVGFNITCSDSGFASMVAAYRWRIPGWYEQWQEVSSQARVELRPPTAGTYELQVEALHTDGIWDQSGLPVAFTVALPWWREPARIAIIAGAAILLGAAAWWRISAWQANGRLMIAERHLELNRERLRIARDMHDEIGARLTYIALLADRTVREGNGNGRAEHSLGTLADSARSAVNALDDIVWVVTPQHDTVGSLVDYLTDYAPSYLQAAGIDCNLNMQVTKPQRPLSLTARQGLLMAVKEALQNVAKHSKARSVRLSFTDQAARLEIEVLDDGVGLKTSNAASSNGLVNMRQRLAEIGGSCEIAPASDNGGVSVRFTLALDFAPAPEKL
jgi:signal transduction histidine kinase